jgi:hypothetical protein
MILTFDNDPSKNEDGLDVMMGGVTPDLIECGECNDYWIQVRRKKKLLELVSKQTGRVIAKRDIDASFTATAADAIGLTAGQFRAIILALQLPDNSRL